MEYAILFATSLVITVLAASGFAPAHGWNKGTATFYGGADASGTMGT